MADMPQWVRCARKFIATGDRDFLAAAVDTCHDPTVRDFLSRPDVGEDKQVPPDVFMQIAQSLKEQSRVLEAVAVELLGCRYVALAAADSLDYLGEDDAHFTAGVCNHAVMLSMSNNFAECEARFLRALATYLAKRHDRHQPSVLLSRAAALFRQLAEQDACIYRSDLAMTLESLGNVLVEEQAWGPAREAYREALEIRRELDRALPHVHRFRLAMTLSNLGHLLYQERDLPAARDACLEAVGICRTLSPTSAHIWRPGLALALNNLGNVLREERDFATAGGVYQEAADTFRMLDKEVPRVYRNDLAMALGNLGRVLVEECRFSAAQVASQEAVSIRRSLATEAPQVYRAALARSLRNLGSVLSDARRFAAACDACQEAVDIWRLLDQEIPHVYRPDLAEALTDVGLVLSHRQNLPAAHDACQQAVELYRALDRHAPHIYRGDLAAALNNLANVLDAEKNLPAARAVYQEAADTYRTLASKAPETYGPNLAKTLSNLGNVFRQERSLLKARDACQEAAALCRKLYQVAPRIYRTCTTAALNVLAKVLEECNEEREALVVSREAIRIAEATDDDRNRFLAKGACTVSYCRYLAHLVQSKKTSKSFQCFAALREGGVRAMAANSSQHLHEAAMALEAIRTPTRRPVCIVLAEYVPPDISVVGVLDSTHGHSLKCACVDGLPSAAQGLFSMLWDVFDEKNRQVNGGAWQAALRQKGELLWRMLPAFLRKALDPNTPHDVLISGDPNWSMFPWESLRCGKGESDWLGLRRSLPRWGPITARALQGLVGLPLGDGQRTAALICPWNVPGQTPLHATLAESYELERYLLDNGYALLPNGSVLRGQDANLQSALAALAAGPAIIHYSGHGGSDGGEEILILWDDLAKNSDAVLGRKELDAIPTHGGKDPPLRNNPLVVLNSCRTGRVHDFGGHREDFAATLLRKGAQAVIASPAPVFDNMGAMFTAAFYAFARDGHLTAADAFARARGIVEAQYRKRKSAIWPAWMMLSFHGNPYAYLPRAEGDLKSGDDGGWLERLASRIAHALHLRSDQEAIELIEDVRGRLEHTD